MTESVLIIGAGPTGLSLAIGLARRGIPNRIVDSNPGPQPGSRGKGLQPRTLEVFDHLGIAERMLSYGRLAMPIRSTAVDGQVTTGGEAPAELIGRPDIPYTTSLLTPQWRVEQVLRERLADFGGSVEFDTTLLSYQQSEAGVSALIVSGETTTSVTTDWLVGCDGGHSLVRREARIDFEGETRDDLRMIVADVAVPGLGRDAWLMWRHPDGFVSLCPLPSTDLFQYQASIAPGQDPRLGLDNLQSVLERRTARTDLRLESPQWSSLWRANVRLVTSYRDRRVLLAGDAAHVHSPAGGQGMNTGIQDAHNLGWKLAAIVRGADPVLLDSYQAERRPIAQHVLALSNARLGQAARGGPVPTRRDTSTLQLDLNYRGSNLSRDDRGDTGADASDDRLRAGDRAPDATKLITTHGEQRLFELLRGGRFTLLAFGSAPGVDTNADPTTLRIVPALNGSDSAHAAHAAGSADDVVDHEGQLQRAYGATAKTLVLLRPDGYIGVISDAGDASVIADYLALTQPAGAG